jgi:lambda repressor-like predicted transcriptional regulator
VNRTRWLATSAAALAVGLGGGAVLAATGSSDPASDFLGDVAQRLGVSQDRLEDAIEDATIARIDAAVDAGDLSKEEADALKDRVRSSEVPAIVPSLPGPVPRFGKFGHPEVFAPGLFPGTDLIETAADYLDMDRADIGEALRDGKSLAELARDRGKSVDGLKEELRAAIREDADQAVEDGVLTKQQADRLVKKLSGAVDGLVEKGGDPGLEFGFPPPEFGPAPPAPPRAGVFPAFPVIDLMETAADYLDMEAADVRRALREGKSLAELARDEGKSVDGLKEALRDAIRKDADQAVEDGVLTERQADRIVEKLAIDKLVEDSLMGGFDFDFEGGGGKYEFHFRVEPEGSMRPSEQRGLIDV